MSKMSQPSKAGELDPTKPTTPGIEASGSNGGPTSPSSPIGRSDESSSATGVDRSNEDEGVKLSNGAKEEPPGLEKLAEERKDIRNSRVDDGRPTSPISPNTGISEWSHQTLAPRPEVSTHVEDPEEDEWQTMPAYAPFDIYDDDGKLIAREHEEETGDAPPGYASLGGAAKGYTRVQVDEDAQSATSMDDNTAYLFKNPVSNQLDTEDEEARDVLAQMRATKELLTDNQRIAYVGLVKLATAEMCKSTATIERTRGAKKLIDIATQSELMWAQKMMVRLYSHMELEAAEQMMIEQLAEHGLQPGDLSPALMKTSHIKNPLSNGDITEPESSDKPAKNPSNDEKASDVRDEPVGNTDEESAPPPPYSEDGEDDTVPRVQDKTEVLKQDEIDVDLRWTVLCDLFLILISDSTYDSRSRVLMEKVAEYLGVSWIDVSRFEKRVTDALEMEQDAQAEDWNEAEHLESRRKRARNRRLAYMGLATVGGGLIIGLSAGLLAPVIGAGLAAGFTTIGVTGTSSFLAGAGGAAVIGSVGTLTGGTIGVRAANRRTGAVKTFEYRPLHNNKRVNLIVTIAGWMNGKVDDVRLPYSTIDPIMGDIYSVLWEPEMLRSMGDTINILATEALTQGLQQILGSTILIALMAAIQLPVVLSKLSYLIDNPWSVSVARADAAGLILADSLIERNLGARPVTLVGFSLGSRVIFSCLREMASKGAVGLIQNVYIFGTPVVVRKDEYLRARSIVSGRFINGYATNDWILGYLFRATGGGIMRVAGLAPVEIPGIENIDVTESVPGHMSYRQVMPKLLRLVGWTVTSDTFTEIEDPDPENHEKRQRELINEIEEARKEIEKQPEKRKFGLFRKNKKRAQKKEWETYDEKARTSDADHGGDPEGPLFDIDAIRKATVELASEGIDVTELETTLPPMRIGNIDFVSPQTPSQADSSARPSLTSPKTSTSVRRSTDSVSATTKEATEVESQKTSYFPQHGRNESDQLYYENEEVTMSFEPTDDRPPSLPPKPLAGSSRSSSPHSRNGWASDSRFMGNTNGPAPYLQSASNVSSRSFVPARGLSRSPSPFKPLDITQRSTTMENTLPARSVSPVHRQNTEPPLERQRNVWADEEDDLGGHEEMSMTFE